MVFRGSRTRRAAVLFSALALAGVLFLVHSMTGPRSLGVEEAYALLRRDPAVGILDVRTDREFRSPEGRLERAVLIPVESLAARMEELSSWRGRTILVYCRSGQRSRRAVQLLGKHGFTAVNLKGGILEWNARGLPVIVEGERR